MMGRPSSSSSSSLKQSHIHRSVSMEDNKLKQEPRLSGAYIRSLVKHLTTSVKTKDYKVTNSLPKSVDCNRGHVVINHNDMQQESPPQPPPPPHKKQVRRRQQTSKPYRERLLNMAEARREIVTALKFHRASMKQRQSMVNNNSVSDQSPSSTTGYLEHYSSLPLVPNYWSIVTNPISHENVDFTLPNQTLGLNLNIHDFKNLDGNLYLNYSSSSSSASTASSSFSSSPSTSSSAVICSVIEQMTADVPEEEVVATNTTTSSTTSTTSTTSSSVNDGLHHAMDEEGMEEIRSLGEQHQMEWDDTVNLLMSARWYKFLNTFEMEQEDGKFDQVMEFPNCMDISEIEGIDGEWPA